jgi:CTP:molybdopterin cytidylyltransferase MocA
VQVDTLLKLRDVFALNPDCVIVPRCDGRNGHPIIIPQGVAVQITNEVFFESSFSLRDFLFRQKAKIKYAAVSDAKILQNINTVQDWRQF